MGTKRRHVWEEWCSLISHYGPGVCTPGCVCCYQCLPLTRFLQPLSGSAQSCPFLLPYPICRLLPHSPQSPAQAVKSPVRTPQQFLNMLLSLLRFAILFLCSHLAVRFWSTTHCSDWGKPHPDCFECICQEDPWRQYIMLMSRSVFFSVSLPRIFSWQIYTLCQGCMSSLDPEGPLLGLFP